MGTETIAVLFTDLVASTEHATRLGPERAGVLRRDHFALLGNAIRAHRGHEVKNIGDGVMAVFPSAADAIGAAISIQQRVHAANRAAQSPMAVRIGVSAGDAEHDGDDYFGQPVVEAARLCAAAGGSRILTTEVVRALVGGRGAHAFESRGSISLKGIETPVTVCDVRWEPAEEPVSLGIPLPGRLGRLPGVGVIGRIRERAVLAECWKATIEGATNMALLAGEPGIGKTTLASDLACAAHGAGGVVLYGRCDEELQVPYQPWVEAIGHLVAHAPDDLLAEHVARHRSQLARLAPELAQRVHLPPPPGGDAESDRYLLYAAVSGLLAETAARAPVLLVIDDLHWADRPTLLLMRQLIGSDGMNSVLVVGTYRESDLASSDPLTDTLAALHREEGVERIAVAGMGDDEVIELMEAAAGHEMDQIGVALAHYLYQETDGNPFFTTEILRHLSESGGIYQDDSGRWTLRGELRDLGLPQSVRDVVGRRVSRLGEQQARVLATASVIGRDFDLDTLAAVAGQDEDSLLDVLDAATTSAVVAEVEGSPGRYTFVHALIQETLYDDLSATRRARVHRQVAEALEATHGERPGDHITALAHHWLEATQPEDAEKAIQYACLAGDRALAQLAPDDALQWYHRAAELLDRDPDGNDHRRGALLARLGDAQRQTGDPSFRETLLAAARLARQTNDTELLVRAALANNRGFAVTGVVDEERIAVLEVAVESIATQETPERAMILALLSAELMYGDRERMQRAAEDAVAVARRVDDPRTLAWVLCRIEVGMRSPDTVDQREQWVREAEAIARRLDDRVQLWFSLANGVGPALERCDLAEVDRRFDQGNQLAASIGQPYMHWVQAFYAASRHLLAGRLQEAETAADQALAIGTESGQPDALPFYGAQLAKVRVAQGRAAEIVELFEQAAEEMAGVPAFRMQLANIYCEVEREDAALAAIQADVDTGFANIPRDASWLVAMGRAASAVVHLTLRDAAEPLYELLVPYQGLLCSTGVISDECVDWALGILSTTLERYDQADTHLARALELHEELGAPYFVATTHLARARLAACHGDVELERQAARLALDLAQRYGFGHVERHARISRRATT